MDAAQAALGGVIVSTVGGWVGAALQRRWAKADRSEVTAVERQKETNARVFEQKLPAYLSLLNALSTYTTGLFDWDAYAVRVPPPSMKDLVPVLEALDRVRSFGARPVCDAAEKVALRHEEFLQIPVTATAQLNRQLAAGLRAEHELVNAIRADLGTGDPLTFDQGRVASLLAAADAAED